MAESKDNKQYKYRQEIQQVSPSPFLPYPKVCKSAMSCIMPRLPPREMHSVVSRVEFMRRWKPERKARLGDARNLLGLCCGHQQPSLAALCDSIFDVYTFEDFTVGGEQSEHNISPCESESPVWQWCNASAFDFWYISWYLSADSCRP